MDNIEKFINKFKEDFGDSAQAESLFSNGYCYHFAIILADLFNGILLYNPIENHFATQLCNDDFEVGLYDITGKILRTNEWEQWALYVERDFLEAQRIINQCIYKEYEDE